MEKRRKKGLAVSPIVIDGRTIAKTFWGKAWCENLESYSDYANRLPRGRTYVRNGSVVHLEIKPGKITALVSGSELYTVEITISALPDCALEVRQGPLRRPDRLAGRAAARQALEERDGGRHPAWRRAVPQAGGDRDEVLVPRLGRHVQARRRRDVRHRRPPRSEARAAVPAPQGRSPGADRGRRRRRRRSPRPANRKGKKTIAAAELADVFGIEMAEAETPAEAAPANSKGEREQARQGPRLGLQGGLEENAQSAPWPGSRKAGGGKGRETSQVENGQGRGKD